MKTKQLTIEKKYGKNCRHLMIVPEITFKTDKTGKVKKCTECKKYYVDNLIKKYGNKLKVEEK